MPLGNLFSYPWGIKQDRGAFSLERQPTALQVQRMDSIKAHPKWTQKQFAESWGVAPHTVSVTISRLWLRERYIHPRSPSLLFAEHVDFHKDGNFKRGCNRCDKTIVHDFWEARIAT